MSKANANKPEAKSKSKSIDVVEPEEKPEVKPNHCKLTGTSLSERTKRSDGIFM